MHREVPCPSFPALAAVALALVVASPAYAYVDPGSGSYLFQIMIAGIAGALYGIKLFWGRLRPFLASLIPFRKRR